MACINKMQVTHKAAECKRICIALQHTMVIIFATVCVCMRSGSLLFPCLWRAPGGLPGVGLGSHPPNIQENLFARGSNDGTIQQDG